MRDAAHQGSSRQGEAVTPQPLETVRRVLEEAGNYFPELEEAAELFVDSMGPATVQANCIR